MADKKNAITDFLADPEKNVEAKKEDLPILLGAFVKFLRERGQYVDPGNLKEQFSETSTVFDKNKVPIEVTKCLVCGKDDYEVKSED